MSSTIRGLIGLVAGLVAGAAYAAWAPGGLELRLTVARAIGQLWLDALRMTIVPLVFVMIAGGLAKDLGLGPTTVRSARLVATGAALLALAAAVGVGSTFAILALWPAPDGAGARMAAALIGDATPAPPSPGMWFEGLIPTNPIRAAADGAIGPLMVFSVAFGLAARALASDMRQRLSDGLEAVLQALFVLIGWVLSVAPAGLAALGFMVGAAIGPVAIGPLAHYVVVNSLVSLVVLGVAYLLAFAAFGSRSIVFCRAAAPAQLIAFSTQSSLASLPAMLAAVRGVRERDVAGEVVLPLAVSLFRIGSAASAISIALYIAVLTQAELNPWAVLGAALLSALISVIAVGLPSQVSYVAILSPICVALGAPLELLVILMSVDVIPDAFRTVANVTGVIGLSTAQPASIDEASPKVDGGQAVTAAQPLDAPVKDAVQ